MFHPDKFRTPYAGWSVHKPGGSESGIPACWIPHNDMSSHHCIAWANTSVPFLPYHNDAVG